MGMKLGGMEGGRSGDGGRGGGRRGILMIDVEGWGRECLDVCLLRCRIGNEMKCIGDLYRLYS